jgi:ABC-type nitrate/sulfonate/bicarbonate transport system permease component
MKFLGKIGYTIGLPAVLLLGWWAYASIVPNFFVPPPGVVATAFLDVWVSERFLTDVLPSIARLLVGLGIAILLGSALGLTIGCVRWLRDVLEPVLEFIRAIPPTITIPVLLLLVGINDTMKITVIVLGSMWPVLLNTVEGVRAIDPVLSDTAQVYRIRGFARLWHLTVPSASPQIMAGVRQSLSLGLILMVISEMFAANEGLGFAIVQFQRTFAIPEMWSGIVLLGLIGIALSIVFQIVQTRVLAWYFGLREVSNAV